MKTVYPYILAILLSPLLVYELEYVVMLIANDKGCFLHDNIVGSVILWIIRAIFFVGFAYIFYQAFLPKYSLIKDQMIRDFISDDTAELFGLEKTT